MQASNKNHFKIENIDYSPAAIAYVNVLIYACLQARLKQLSSALDGQSAEDNEARFGECGNHGNAAQPWTIIVSMQMCNSCEDVEL